MKMLVSKMPLVIGEFYETVLKPMALEKGGITAMTIVPLGAIAVKTSPFLIRSYIPELQDAGVVNGSGDIIDLDRLQVFALDYLKKQPFELAGCWRTGWLLHKCARKNWTLAASNAHFFGA